MFWVSNKILLINNLNPLLIKAVTECNSYQAACRTFVSESSSFSFDTLSTHDRDGPSTVMRLKIRIRGVNDSLNRHAAEES